MKLHPKTRLDEPDLTPSPVVLLLVDFINPLRFPGAADLAPFAAAAARATRALRKRISGSGIQTIYANDNYGNWRADFHGLWQRCRRIDGEAGLMARLLKPTAEDFTILKPRHSAFYATPLDLVLHQLRCRRIILAGLAADNCVLFTAMDAYLRGYSLWVPADCVAAETDEAKDRALEHMQRVLKAETRLASRSTAI